MATQGCLTVAIPSVTSLPHSEEGIYNTKKENTIRNNNHVGGKVGEEVEQENGGMRITTKGKKCAERGGTGKEGDGGGGHEEGQ